MGTLQERLTTAVRNRFRGSALGSYGAGLGCDCGDCPTPGPDAFVPGPRDEIVPAAEEVRRLVR